MGKLRPSGGYRDARSFQTSTIIYDGTYRFCENFLDSRSRTVDQMVQAACSGRQNIAEGSHAAATSSQTELRLLNTARSSLEELLLDFEDYLRQRRLKQWAPDSPEAMAVRQVPQKFKHDQPDQSDQERWALYAPWLEHNDPAVRANALICLINQANFLLDHQIAALEKAFVEEGGYSEAPRSTLRDIFAEPCEAKNVFPPCDTCAQYYSVAGGNHKVSWRSRANNLPQRGWRNGNGRIGQVSLFHPITFPPARSAANPWSCAPPNPARTPASSSGVVQATPSAKEL